MFVWMEKWESRSHFCTVVFLFTPSNASAAIVSSKTEDCGLPHRIRFRPFLCLSFAQIRGGLQGWLGSLQFVEKSLPFDPLVTPLRT